MKKGQSQSDLIDKNSYLSTEGGGKPDEDDSVMVMDPVREEDASIIHVLRCKPVQGKRGDSSVGGAPHGSRFDILASVQKDVGISGSHDVSLVLFGEFHLLPFPWC
ncbi:hypothetical protein V6N13_036849 [Hibiscus sabdariffa]